MSQLKEDEPVSQRLTQTGKMMLYTEAQLRGFHKLPASVVINGILPFVGGVRSKESRISELQSQLKTFMRIAEANITQWHHYSSLGCTDTLVVPDRSIDRGALWYKRYEFWWRYFKERIDNTLMVGNRGAKYDAKDLNFTTSEWLKHWVEIDEIPMVDFVLVSIDVWLFYAELHRPKPLVDYKRW